VIERHGQFPLAQPGPNQQPKLFADNSGRGGSFASECIDHRFARELDFRDKESTAQPEISE
jgi:hypothetical protein